MSKAKGGAKRPTIDWQAVRADYEAGDLTIEQVATKHGTTISAVKKRAARGKWKREKQPDAATFKRNQAKPVMGQVIVIPPLKQADAGPQPGADDDETPPAPTTPTEAILAHRRAAARARALSEKLIGELEAQTMGGQVLEALVAHHFAGGGETGAAIRQMLRSFLETGHRAKVLSYITKALSELVNVERQAFGIAAKPDAIDDPIQRATLEQAKATGASRTKEEVARAMLDLIERAAREKAGSTVQ